MPNSAKACTDPIVGAILSGWRYDISNISAEMRTDYEQHLVECLHCRRRQTIARTIDVLLISVTSLSIVAFLLAAVVLHRIEMITHIPARSICICGTRLYFDFARRPWRWLDWCSQRVSVDAGGDYDAAAELSV